MSSRGLRVVILSRSARGGDQPAWGLGQDSKLVEQVLRESSATGSVGIESVDHIDPIQFYGSSRAPQVVDVQIHLEVPCRAAWRWATTNIVVVNPEWWPASAWDWALAAKGGADLVIFKTAHARSLFPEVDGSRARVLSWRAGGDVLATSAPAKREFLYLIGASGNKMAAAGALLRSWKDSWPRILVVGTEAVLAVLRKGVPDFESRGITFQEPFPDAASRIAAQAAYKYHVVTSEAEGFGYSMAEAAALGCLPLWTAIPPYMELWGDVLGSVGRIEMMRGGPGKFRDLALRIRRDAVERAVESLLTLGAEEEHGLREALKQTAAGRIKEYRAGWKSVLTTVEKAVISNKVPNPLPPRPLAAGDLPHVAVVTLTRNRPHWFANMARNLLLSDYPPDKMTWIVVDDGDAVLATGGGGRVDAAVAKFQSVHTRLSVKYVSLARPMAIGAKRNRACEAAPAEASVFVMMDDDDHYPAGSIAGRVAWLRTTGTGCVSCATLPMYHCGKYISAVNVPPLDLAPEERVSEATLCFTRAFWEARPFPAAVSVAEGEGFLEGRVSETVEIPPSGIIVSFLHGGNSTSRRVPADSEPNGCHYGFDDEFFTYLSNMP